MGELIQLKNWEAERKRKAIAASVEKMNNAIAASVEKMNNAIKNVQEILKDADFNRKSQSGDNATGERRIAKYSNKPTDSSNET